MRAADAGAIGFAAGAAANLPIVYALVATPAAGNALVAPVLATAFLSVGAAWCAGFLLEGRVPFLPWFVASVLLLEPVVLPRAVAALGVTPAFPFVVLGAGAIAAAGGAVALAALTRSRAPRAATATKAKR